MTTIMSIIFSLIFWIYLAGVALVGYILILLVQVLRLSIQALKKYLQQP